MLCNGASSNANCQSLKRTLALLAVILTGDGGLDPLLSACLTLLPAQAVKVPRA